MLLSLWSFVFIYCVGVSYQLIFNALFNIIQLMKESKYLIFETLYKICEMEKIYNFLTSLGGKVHGGNITVLRCYLFKSNDSNTMFQLNMLGKVRFFAKVAYSSSRLGSFHGTWSFYSTFYQQMTFVKVRQYEEEYQLPTSKHKILLPGTRTHQSVPFRPYF